MASLFGRKGKDKVPIFGGELSEGGQAAVISAGPEWPIYYFPGRYSEGQRHIITGKED